MILWVIKTLLVTSITSMGLFWFLIIDTSTHMGAGELAQLSAACLGWKQANLSKGPEHPGAQTVGEDPVKALVVWWKKRGF